MSKMFEIFLTFFDFFQIFQKVFPCIPEGYIRKESDENRVLKQFLFKFWRLFFDIFEFFLIVFLFNMTPAPFRPGDIHTGNRFYIIKRNFLS